MIWFYVYSWRGGLVLRTTDPELAVQCRPTGGYIVPVMRQSSPAGLAVAA